MSKLDLSIFNNIKTTLGLVLLILFVNTSLSSAQGTGDIWVLEVNGQNDVINGYRHNVDILGTEIFFSGDYNFVSFLDLRIRVNGVSRSPISWSTSSGWEASFTVDSPCSKMVVEFQQFGIGVDEWTEPVEIFVVSGSNNTCTPECDNCNKASSGQGAGYPVDVVTGKMYYSTTDLALSGPNGPRFERYYDNQTTYSQDLGFGWRHTYSHYLDLANLNLVKYYDNHGRLIMYGKNRTNQYDEDWFFATKLTTPTGAYEVTTWDKTVYRFNTSGKLTRITDRKGNVQNIAYDTNNPPRISTVTDSFGKTLTFSYSGTNIKIQTITANPGSRTIAFSYDGSNNLQNFTDPTNKIWIHEYQTSGDVHNLTGIKDPLNHYIETHTYFSNDKTQTSAKHGNQESLSFSYGSNSTTTTDSVSRNTTYNWDGNLKLVTQISGPSCGCGGNQTRTFTWDNFLRKTSEKDGKNNETVWVWIDRTINDQTYPTPRLSSITEANGTSIQRTTQYSNYYNYGDLREDLFQTETSTSVDTVGQNRVITYGYATPGNLTSRQTAGYSNGISQSITESSTYNSRGLILTHNGPRTDVNDTTTYTYYPDNAASIANRGQLNTVSNALTQITTFENYDLYGNSGKVTDPNSVITESTYDNWGRSLDVKIKADGTYPFDILTQNRYQDDGLLDYIIHPEGNVTDSTYDSQHRQIEVQQKPNLSGFGDKIVYQYDTEGNKTREEYHQYNGSTWDLRKFSDFAYDSFNRLWKVINPNSSYTENLYDAAGNLQYVDDSNHPHGGPTHQFTNSYDALNRLISVVVLNSSLNENTQYGYDSDTNIISITDPEGIITTEDYDDFGRNIKTISPDSGTTTRTFDPARNLITETNANGIAATRAYDSLNRNTSVTFPNSSYNITYTYDSATVPYGKGRRTGMSDESGGTTFNTYDRQGRLLKETKKISSVNYITQYSFNKNGTLTGMTYPTSTTISYSIDLTEGRPTTAAMGSVSITGLNYYPFGQLSSATFPNGKSLTRTFDTKYGISSNVVSGSVLSLTYSKDNESNITSITDSITPANNKTFVYDDRYQLKTATGPWGTKNYTYDKNGNRKTKVLNAASTTYNYTSGTNRLASTTGTEPATYGYDNAGNITSDGAIYIYGDHNRLSIANSGQQSPPTYKYDGRNLRSQKSVTAGPMTTTTLYFYDQQGKLISEISPGLTRDYLYVENELMVRLDQSLIVTTSFYHNDHLGTPVALTNSAGNVTWRAEYFPFGKVYSQTGSGSNNVRFPGQYFDSETSLHYNWWRFYSNKIGRYYEVDPVPREGQSNVYAYVDNSPLSFDDPNGQVRSKGYVAGDIVCRRKPGAGSWEDVVLFTSNHTICVLGKPLALRERTAGASICRTAQCNIEWLGPDDPYPEMSETGLSAKRGPYSPNRVTDCFNKWKNTQPPGPGGTAGPCWGERRKGCDQTMQCSDFITSLHNCKFSCDNDLNEFCRNVKPK